MTRPDCSGNWQGCSRRKFEWIGLKKQSATVWTWALRKERASSLYPKPLFFELVFRQNASHRRKRSDTSLRTENDAIFILDRVLIPWENVFVYGDLGKASSFFPRSGFFPRAMFHGCTRLAVKLDFLAGLHLKALDITGSKDFRGVRARLGELLAWRNMMWALTDSMAHNPDPWIGDTVLPNANAGLAYRWFTTVGYPRVKEIIEQDLGSALIYLNSHAADFKSPSIRKYLDKYCPHPSRSSRLRRTHVAEAR